MTAEEVGQLRLEAEAVLLGRLVRSGDQGVSKQVHEIAQAIALLRETVRPLAAK